MSATILGPAIPQLPSGDIQVTKKFFTEKLGFEVGAIFPDEKFLIMRRENAEILLAGAR